MITPEAFGEHPERESKYKKYLDIIKFPKHLNIDIPPSYCDYTRIAEMNNINLQIWETKLEADNESKIYPKFKSAFNSKIVSTRKTITMLLVDNGTRAHYTYVTDKSRLLVKQQSKHKAKKYICDNCLKTFHSEKARTKHLMLGCEDHQPAKLIMPEKGKNDKCFFENIHKQIAKPYVMYGDLEAYTHPDLESVKGSYQHHQHSCSCYTVIDRSAGFTKPTTKMFENLNDFLRSVFIDAEHYCQLMKDSCDPDSDSDRYRGKILNSENQKNFHDATDCYLCNKCFLTEGEFLKNP